MCVCLFGISLELITKQNFVLFLWHQVAFSFSLISLYVDPLAMSFHLLLSSPHLDLVIGFKLSFVLAFEMDELDLFGLTIEYDWID